MTRWQIVLGLVVAASALLVWLLIGRPGDGQKIDLTGRTIEWQELVSPELAEAAESFKNQAQAAVIATTMKGASYLGRDIGGNEWSLVADEVQQAGQTVSMTAVAATATAPRGTLTFSANKGMFDQGNSDIRLAEDVVVKGVGLILKTGDLSGNLTAGEAQSSGSVTIVTTPNEKAGSAALTAGHLQIRDHGAIISLTGGVSSTFIPARAE